MKQGINIRLLVICIIALTLNGTLQGVCALPSAIGVADTTIWELESGLGSIYLEPFRTSTKRLVILSMTESFVEFRADTWRPLPGSDLTEGYWVPHSHQVGIDDSTNFWLEEGTEVGDIVVDCIYSNPDNEIVSIDEVVEENTGQDAICVVTRNPITEAGWNITYDTSSRIALRMSTIRISNFRWILFNSSIDLGLPIVPQPMVIPGFPLGAILVGLIMAVFLVATQRKRLAAR